MTNDKSEAFWQAKLSPDEFRVMRQKGTEPPFSGALLHNQQTGTYHCRACGQKLFDSRAKFDSGSGWPSFSQSSNRAGIKLTADDSYGMARTEVSCRKCGSHLGHVFDDGPPEQGGQRYCINSLALQFNEVSPPDGRQPQ